MPASAVERLVTALPQVSFIQLCGQTEGGPGGVYCDVEQVKARPDASGRQALPFTEARVADPQGHDVGPGCVGELLLRGESVMKGYWNKPAETAEALRGGWLHTSDLARVDADGYLTLVDRLKDMIITGGHNVYSVEVEGALAAHPDVVDVAVVGLPHPDYGESIVAVITPRDGATITLDDVPGVPARPPHRVQDPARHHHGRHPAQSIRQGPQAQAAGGGDPAASHGKLIGGSGGVTRRWLRWRSQDRVPPVVTAARRHLRTEH